MHPALKVLRNAPPSVRLVSGPPDPLPEPKGGRLALLPSHFAPIFTADPSWLFSLSTVRGAPTAGVLLPTRLLRDVVAESLDLRFLRSPMHALSYDNANPFQVCSCPEATVCVRVCVCVCV